MQLAAITLTTTLTLLSSASTLPVSDSTAIDTLELSQPASGMTPREPFNEADVLAITAPNGCGLISCARVIGQAVCVAKALDDDNWKNIFKCAKAKQLCNCAECFKSLGTFLKKHGVC